MVFRHRTFSKGEIPSKGPLSALRVFHVNSDQPARDNDSSSSAPVRRVLSILAVDDEPVSLTLIRRTLSGQDDFRVVAISDPRKVLPLLAEFHFDVLITDTFMPELMGYELAPQVRAAHPHIKIIAVTATHTSSDYPEGSIDAFIQKPYTVTELVAKVRELAFQK